MCDKLDKLCPVGLTNSCGYWVKQQKQIEQLQAENKKFKLIIAEWEITHNERNVVTVEQKYLEAVNNRCSLSRPSKCFDCKVVNTSSDYIEQLQAENERSVMKEKPTKQTNSFNELPSNYCRVCGTPTGVAIPHELCTNCEKDIKIEQLQTEIEKYKREYIKLRDTKNHVVEDRDCLITENGRQERLNRRLQAEAKNKDQIIEALQGDIVLLQAKLEDAE